MYAVLFSGPAPLLLHVTDAATEHEAAAAATNRLPAFLAKSKWFTGMTPDQFRVECVTQVTKGDE